MSEDLTIKGSIKFLSDQKERLKLLWEYDKITAILIMPFFSLLGLLINFINGARFDNQRDFISLGVYVFIILVFLMILLVSINGSSKRVKAEIDSKDVKEDKLKKLQAKIDAKKEVITKTEETKTKHIDLAKERLQILKENNQFTRDVYWKQKSYQFLLLTKDSQALFDEALTLVRNIVSLCYSYDLTEDGNKPIKGLVNDHVERLEAVFTKHAELPAQLDATFKDFLSHDFVHGDLSKGNIMKELEAIMDDIQISDVSINVPKPKQVPKPNNEVKGNKADFIINDDPIADTKEVEEIDEEFDPDKIKNKLLADLNELEAIDHDIDGDGEVKEEKEQEYEFDEL